MLLTTTELDALRAERDSLRESHKAWCDDVNGPFGEGEGSYCALRRDQDWRRLCEVEAALEAHCEAERAAEEAAE